MDLIIGVVAFTVLVLFVWMIIDGLGVDEVISPADSKRLKNRISQEGAVKNHQPDKYAVLIRGDYEERFVADTSLVYQVLLENGFKSEHIYILADARRKAETYFHPIDDIATKGNLEILMDHLTNIVDEEDLLFICLIDHGGKGLFRNPDDPVGKMVSSSTFNLRGEDLNELELKSRLSKIYPKTGILVFEFCFSGGFAERLGGTYVAIASTDSHVEGYSKAGNSFIGYVFEALSQRKGDEVDINKDRRVSLQEAFDYAKRNHYKTKSGKQKPVVKSDTPLDEIFIDNQDQKYN